MPIVIRPYLGCELVVNHAQAHAAHAHLTPNSAISNAWYVIVPNQVPTFNSISESTAFESNRNDPMLIWIKCFHMLNTSSIERRYTYIIKCTHVILRQPFVRGRNQQNNIYSIPITDRGYEMKTKHTCVHLKWNPDSTIITPHNNHSIQLFGAELESEESQLNYFTIRSFHETRV